MFMQSMFGESQNMNNKNRHLAFWNIRVVVLRMRVRTYEVVACYFGKIEQAFLSRFEQPNYGLGL